MDFLNKIVTKLFASTSSFSSSSSAQCGRGAGERSMGPGRDHGEDTPTGHTIDQHQLNILEQEFQLGKRKPDEAALTRIAKMANLSTMTVELWFLQRQIDEEKFLNEQIDATIKFTGVIFELNGKTSSNRLPHINGEPTRHEAIRKMDGESLPSDNNPSISMDTAIDLSEDGHDSDFSLIDDEEEEDQISAGVD